MFHCRFFPVLLVGVVVVLVCVFVALVLLFVLGFCCVCLVLFPTGISRLEPISGQDHESSRESEI